jgi:hypothetical protein
MHYRRDYQQTDGEMAMRHVRDFMNKLASRVRERKTN